MEQMRVIKVVETKVTVLTVRGGTDTEIAEGAAIQFAKEGSHAFQSVTSVTVEGVTSEVKAQVNFQLINDRPEPKKENRR